MRVYKMHPETAAHIEHRALIIDLQVLTAKEAFLLDHPLSTYRGLPLVLDHSMPIGSIHLDLNYQEQPHAD